MGLFSRNTDKKPSGEKARVESYGRGKHQAKRPFDFLILGDGRKVYFNKDDLDKAGIANLNEGQEVFVQIAQGDRGPVSLKATSISLC